ncbi:MAG TPA: hypothetical protein VF791_13730 [Pyrinomonadaceae bacterium]
MLHQPTKLSLRAVLFALSLGFAAPSRLHLAANLQRPASAIQQNTAARGQARISVRLKATLAGHRKSINEIAFSPGGELLATGGEDNTIRLWDAGTGELKAVLTLAEKQKLNGFLWSYDGRKIAATSYRGSTGKGQIRVWVTDTGELKTTIELNHRDYLTDFKWSPQGRILLTASEDGIVKLWDAETGGPLETLDQDPRKANETDSFFGSMLPGKKFSDFRQTSGYFDAVGQNLLTLSYNRPAKLWDVATGRLKTELPSDGGPEDTSSPPPGRALFSPDRRLVVRTNSRGVTLVDTTTGEAKQTLGEIGRPLAFSPDGSALLTLEYSLPRAVDQLSLWDVATGQKLLRFETLPYGVKTVYWSPKGNALVVEGYYGMHTRLMDARTGRVVAKLPYDGCAAGSWFGSSGCEPFVFSADGRLFLKQKKPLRLWSALTGELLTTLEEADAFARFSPTDNRLLVTRGKDKKALLFWDVFVH